MIGKVDSFTLHIPGPQHWDNINKAASPFSKSTVGDILTVLNEPKYVTEFDTTVFWQFLADVKNNASLVELVQNDLDASASNTLARLEEDRLLCTGNGTNVSSNGWRRLRMLLGAGTDVESKHDGIGVKNFGIRSLFRLGDTIVVRSGGKKTQLSIRIKGPDELPYPGAWTNPMKDTLTLNNEGTTIEVPLRPQPLPVELAKGGETLLLPVWNKERREKLYEEFVSDVPTRFFGTVRPGLSSDYALEIQLPEGGRWTRARFRASKPLPLSRGLGGKRAAMRFRRWCHIESESSPKRVFAEEGLFLRCKELNPSEARHYRAYRFKGDVGVEISWPINSRGQPISEDGIRRYPIGMPVDSQTSFTDLGFHFSGPYHMALDRSVPAPGASATNDTIDEECLLWTAKILKSFLVPRFGPRALWTIRPKTLTGYFDKGQHGPVERVIDELARMGGLLAEPRTGRRGGGIPRSLSGTTYSTLPSLTSEESDDIRFLIPTWSWEGRQAENVLYPPAPERYPLIHRKTPPFIVEHLHRNHIENEGLSGLDRYDEIDVIQRLGMNPDTAYHPWSSNRRARHQLSSPQLFSDHLHAIDRFLAEAPPREVRESTQEFEHVRESGFLLSHNRGLQPWGSVFRHKGNLPKIPGLAPPLLLHPDLATFRCIRKGNPLEVARFDVDQYLHDAIEKNPKGLPKSRCPEIFAWLQDNVSNLRASTLQGLRNWRIWPTRVGDYVEFASLCKPSLRVERILSFALKTPSNHLVRLKGVSTQGRGTLRIRTVPNEEEIGSWFNHCRKEITLRKARKATKSQRLMLDSLEKSLEALGKNRRIRNILRDICQDHITLARDGTARPLGNLVLETNVTKRCQIPERWIPESNRRSLYRLLGVNQKPTIDSLVDAIQTFPSKSVSDDAYRLEQLRKAWTMSPDVDLSETRLLPLNGRLLRPVDVALGLSSKKYWGKWKMHLPTSNLSPILRSFLGKLGCVTKVDRTAISGFLDWLVERGNPSTRTRFHISNIIRLISEGRLDPRAFIGKPALPLENGTLVPISKASSRGRVLVDNFPELAKEIREKSGGTWQFIVTHPEGVSRPIGLRLIHYGIPDLRSKAGKPIEIQVAGSQNPAESLYGFLVLLKQEKMRKELFPRLEQVGIHSDMIRADWHKTVSDIGEIELVDEVRAVYKLGSQQFPIERNAVVDDGILWVRRTAPDPRLSFFEGLIEVIGRQDAPPYLPSVMLAALTREFEFSPVEIRKEELEDEYLEGIPEVEIEDRDERGATHPPTKPDSPPTTVIPPHLPKPGGEYVPPPPKPVKPTPEYERKLKRWLKQDQYAYHCQACLAEAEPVQLAPKGSYSYRLANRQRSIEAHHIRHKSAKGAGRPWNFLVLCTYHHRELGDRITPRLVLEAIDKAKPSTRSWKGTKFQGKILSLEVPELLAPVRLFCRREHLKELQSK